MGVVMIKNPVLIMALYDIGRDNWNNFTMSYNTYLAWMRNTLSLDANIVVYTENKFVDKIKEYRKEFDKDLNKTIIVTIPLEELDCYKLYNDKLNSLMFSESFKKKIHHDVPEMTKPLYNIIMFNKLYFLKHSKDNEYFNNDLLIWADAGGLREDIKNYENSIWPSLDKINLLDENKITFFSHQKDIRITDSEYHAMSQARYIQGTCFFVPSHLIDDFVIDCDQTINSCIDNNFIGSDEKVFDLTYLKNSDKYYLVKCTWRTYFDLFKNNGSFMLPDNKKRIFIDFGSHYGGSLNRFIDNDLNIDENWEIHLFEPNPGIRSRNIIDINKRLNINYHTEAAWISNEILNFRRYGDDGLSGGSLVDKTNEGNWYGDYYDTISVKGIDAAQFLKSLDANIEIYIHMDIEYSEYQVLQYLLNCGWPENIKKIWVEFHDKNKYKDQIEYLISEISKYTQLSYIS
jgi:FkbM family methyltransferase